ncbi:hypothetical protein SMICM17S_07402 [Streptomyces microflavus]
MAGLMSRQETSKGSGCVFYPKRTAALASVPGACSGRLGGADVPRPPPAPRSWTSTTSARRPSAPKGAVSPIDIKGVRSGGGYKLTMSCQKGVSSSPVELGKGAMNPSAVIEVGGAETGKVQVSGPANAEAIPANTIKISDLSGTYTPKKSGKVTLTAGVLTIKALGRDHDLYAQAQPRPLPGTRCRRHQQFGRFGGLRAVRPAGAHGRFHRRLVRRR